MRPKLLQVDMAQHFQPAPIQIGQLRCVLFAVLLIYLTLAGCAGSNQALHPIQHRDTGRGPTKAVVRQVLSKTPMDQAGLRPGDEILAIDDKPIVGVITSNNFNWNKSTRRLRIKRGSDEFVLDVRRRRATDLWGLITSYLDANNNPIAVYYVAKASGKAPAFMYNYDATQMGVQVALTSQKLLTVHVIVLNPNSRPIPFSIQNVRVLNGDRGLEWPIPAGEVIAKAYAGVLNQPDGAYLPSSAQAPSYTATTTAHTTISNGYMQTYGTTYIAAQENPYNSFVDGYNLGVALRNNAIRAAKANMERDLVALESGALKTTSVPPLGTVEGNIYYWLEQTRKPYFVEVTFNGQKAVFEFDDQQFAP